MKETVENLIVRVGKVINEADSPCKIELDTIHEWKIFTGQYFNLSPSYCFIENEFYQNLPENLKIQLMLKEMAVTSKEG